MQLCMLVVCLSVCLVTVNVSAQQMESASGAEIGTLFGLSHFRADGDGATLIGLPSAFGPSIAGNPSIYVSWFPGERFSIGPELGLGRFSGEGISFTSLYLAGRGAFHSGNVTTSGAYVFGRGALQVLSDGGSGESESDIDASLGAGLGYRWRVGSGFIVRAEGGYRRWFDGPGTNDFSLLLGLGARAGRVAAIKDTRTTEAEIGTLFGLSHFRADGDGVTLIGLPSAPVSFAAGIPSIYVSWFLDEQFSIGPEFSLGRTSAEGSSFTSLYLAGRGAFHTGSVTTSGAYVFGRGALRVLSDGGSGESESDTDASLGAGLGYRWRVGSGFIVRAEGGYRRWFDDPGTNDFSLRLGLGASVGGG